MEDTEDKRRDVLLTWKIQNRNLQRIEKERDALLTRTIQKIRGEMLSLRGSYKIYRKGEV